MSECRNTDKTLHENIDCRIIWTEQHALAIDVGGSVIVRDPVDWHASQKEIQRLEAINAELLHKPMDKLKQLLVYLGIRDKYQEKELLQALLEIDNLQNRLENLVSRVQELEHCLTDNQ